MDNKDDHMKDMLDGLTDMINKAYLPLMQDKQDTRMQMEKFVKQVQTSMQQAYGNITIRVPDLPEGTPEELGLDTQLVNELTVTVDQWVVTIKETIDRENAKKKEGSSAQGETEYWRQRNATFNTLFQQLNLQPVKKILQVLKLKSEQSDGYNMEAFDAQYQQFQKLYNQAKDFVKFLSTLDRQFKNINRGELTVIEETLPSLLTGLKLIWTISRHINQTENKFEDILEAISNEICHKVKSQIEIQRIFRKKPEDAIKIIKQGKTVLESWKNNFDATKRDIETQQTIKRWDFSKAKEIFSQPIYMKKVLEDIEKACIIYQEFLAILGPDLAAVTGSSEQIENEKDRVWDQIKKLESFPRDVFSDKYASQWKTQFEQFLAQIQQIDSHVVSLIDSTFTHQLTSSEAAFDLLSKFQNVKTREAIKDLLNRKYEDVLVQYDKELTQMKILFEKGVDNPPISKNMPPKAGQIAWARSIMGRIKGPISKFRNKSDQLMTNVFKDVAYKYVALAKKLDKDYEQKIFETWKRENTDKAIEYLGGKDRHILSRFKGGKDQDATYEVNFARELRVIIREAKFLDRIGKTIPQTIINIALQEKDYMIHVDKLNQLLRGYKSAMANLKPVEKKLLKIDIEKLNKHMDKGVTNHNWFSLSIDEYIRECQIAIDTFRETKNIVLQHASNIEKKVVNIENAQIIRQIDFNRKSPMDISEFSDFFESYRIKVLSELVKDYQNIGEQYLKSIEECTVKASASDSKACEEMRPYYKYWERRIFNAITKMIVRALAANKTIWMRTERPCLIKMTSSYNHPEITFHPTVDELRTQLEKFSRNILESTKQFGRWWDGFCKIFEVITHEETAEKYIPYTFFDDVMQNKMISQLHYEIIQCKGQIIEKFNLLVRGWTKRGQFKTLFDKNEMTKLQKQIDKSQSTAEIEKKILIFKIYRDMNLHHENEQLNYFVLIDNSEVKESTIQKVNEWLEILGDSLKQIATKELKAIQTITSDYKGKLNNEVGAKEMLQALLNNISDIKNQSMDMEFRILEVQEQFRVLSMYEYGIDAEVQGQVDNLMVEWSELLDFADRKDFDMNEFKTNFAEVSKQEVEAFKVKIKEEYESYLQKGPGTSSVSLEEGVELLNSSKEKVRIFNKTREELVLSEKLFNLPISKYPELIAMDEANKKYDRVYSIFKDHQSSLSDFSSMSWSKLDASILVASAEKFEKLVKKLGNKLDGAEGMHPFVKLKEAIIGFKDSLPLIEQLKNPAIQERHWKRIMDETGKDLGEINLKTLTLSKVFELELQNYEDKVMEICIEAKEEAKNEENLQKIDAVWKQTNFVIVEYKKGAELKGHALREVDDIKVTLEDNILILQSLSASKYIRAMKARVQQWEKDLNTISDTIDTWMVVQRKWMYLEGIFASDDIKLQLPEEAKKFGKTDIAYKKIMESAYKQPNCMQACVKADGGNRLGDLKNISFDLDKCQKSLSNYLESKQMSFPRFYFISNEDLLAILGNSDAKQIQGYMLSLFDNCKKLEWEGEKKMIGMYSDEGEYYDFVNPVKVEGKVEDWMNKIDDEMKSSLQTILKTAVFNYAKSDRIEWIKKEIGMIALCGTQIWWTFAVEDVFRRVAAGDKHAMKKELAQENIDLNNLIALVRESISSCLRKCVNTLIILDVHARDVVDKFVRDSILSSKEFAWESVLRFYWDLKKDDCDIRQCTGSFAYCYEYQGLNGRLVITPLTDRCVMTLTTALSFFLGGAPAGPAGTGKTETVKDLAKGLALRCVVTNCGETMDFVACGIIFSGLIQTGFWGCFDEFNRINVEVLSVVSAQIKMIQNGLSFGKKKIDFLGTDMRLIPTIGIYITMNPGYAGRSELPDNLKALFRPVTMCVPDLLLICENMLMSEGFTQAKVLAKKMTVLYKLSKEQLSKQYHYDFGLRALKSVLVMAGQLKRSFSDLPEDIVLMRALRDMNMPKFVYEDVPLFTGLITDLFPGVKADRVGYETLNGHIVDVLEKRGCKHSDDDLFYKQVDKIVQLFETMQTRHTTMVVGPTGAGKSVIIDGLAASLKAETNHPTQMYTINPKMITLNELYGVLDPDSRDWTDGLLSKIFKDINVDLVEGKEERRWIIYDGDVDAVWVENMNSVMDDNRILTLANGDRIRLLKHCAMLFEVFDLQYASPATISRCGMVFVDAKNLGYAPFYERWVAQKKEAFGEIMAESLKELYSKYVYQCIERIFEGNAGGEELVEPMHFITPRTNLNLIIQLCDLVDSMLPETEPPCEFEQLEKFYIFCIIWSLGGTLVAEDREKFSEFLRNLSGLILPSSSLYDNFFNVENLSFLRWEEKVMAYEPPPSKKFAAILVPTVDTVRYSWLFSQIMALNKPALFCGDSGAAKTVTVQACFKELDPEKYMILNINFSSKTSSMDFQKIIEENIDKRTFKTYGPKASGKKMVVFIDDMNMPKIDTYGTQQPLALSLFLIGRKQLYQRGGDLELREIADTQFVGCITPSAGGNNRVDPRVMTLFSVFHVTAPSRETIEKIYVQILEKHVDEFAEDIKGVVGKVTQATVQLFETISEKLPRTPLKFHYVFNLRDLSRIYEGLLQSTVDKFTTKELFIRLWRNEANRVFCDKLVDETDQTLISQTVMGEIIKEHFKDVEEYVLKDPIIFGDYSMANPTDEEAEDPRLYEDLGDYAVIKEKLDKMLEDYGFDHKPMSLVLFNDALEHVTKIHRILRFPKGCGLLVGFGGSGKQSLTKLATFTAGYEIYTISLVRGYKEADFREDLRSLYKLVLIKPQTFLFTDSHVAEEGFLELINNILTIGMVPALFPEEEKDGLIGPLDDEMRKQKMPETKEFRWNYYVNKCRENLHIILAMSPAGDVLRVRCRNFPGLISNTNVDWFFPWPEDALTAVANNFMGAVELDDDARLKVTEHLVMVHLSVQTYSLEFKAVFKRNNYSTPKNYLDFISNYIAFLRDKRKLYEGLVRRLEGGLSTLARAQQDTEVLSKELAVQNEIIAEKTVVVTELIKDINAKTEIANVKAKAAAEKKAILEVQAKEIGIKSAEAEKALEEAVPALQAAQEALLDIKAASITEIKALASPPQVIQDVCTIAYFLYPKTTAQSDWANVKLQLLGDTSLLASLKSYEVAKTKADGAKRAKTKMDKLMKDYGNLPADEMQRLVNSKNLATGGLFKWCVSTLMCYDIYKNVEPLRKNAEKLQKDLDEGLKDLAETEKTVAELTATLKELNAAMKIKKDELDELQAKSAEMTRKLNAASQLITGLGGEQVRWTSDMKTIEEDKIKLVGDCLTGSAFLSYCGPFNSVLRQKMIFETWKADLVEKELPNKEDFRLDTFLTDEVTVSKWGAEGLPSDELSVQNGILTNYASRWPLCIDPQMQAVTWIKTKEAKNPFEILTFNMGNYIKLLEMAIKFGKSVLFEAISEEIDPMIDPVLEKNIVKEAGVNMLTLGDQKMEYHDDFRMFLTTKISNPNYTPEIFGKTMIINFSVTMTGLRDQLLNEVVQYERPELEEARKKLIVETAENKATLKGLEDTLLSELSKETDIPLVDNVPLIEVLNTAKTKSVEIGKALEVAKETNADIEVNRESYKEVAWRGSILFFSISGLSAISEMYEYSLSSYMTVFMNSLSTSRKDNILQNRLRNIKDKLTMLVYDFTCMGIFEKHKLMYSFQMVTMIMDGDSALNKVELDFFLKGNTSLDPVEQKKPASWLSENGWKDIQRLETLGEVWTGFIDNLVKHKNEWKTWYDLEAPENAEIPCGYTQKLSKYQVLSLMRVIRPDRVVNSIKNFIIDKMNDYYVKSPPISYEKIYSQSTCFTPIVFILSPGADPFSDVQKLVETIGLGMNKFRFLALGQGMGDQAKQYIEGGSMRGHWVMLQNCHLLVSWMKTLEAIYEQITKPDKGFRLWLTTAPTDKFPLGILQKSLKIVTEPPDGLGQNIKQTYSKLSEEIFEGCPKFEFKPMLYVLSFFHAVIQERKKFGKIGWNVSYDFNMSDYSISYQLISMYLNKAMEAGDEELPWETLRYLIGEAMYGGRVTDDNDRRSMMCYLEEYMGPFIFDTNQKYFFSQVGGDYVVPYEDSMELTLESIDQLSLFTQPGVFGLHSNAEITYYTNAAKDLWNNIMMMQTDSGGGGAGGVNREDVITQLADDIQTKTLPQPFDEYNIRKSFDIPSPTQVVLLQELERYNKLIVRMHSSITDLKRALKGEIGMSVDLDVLGNCFFNGLLPPMWSKLAPQTEKKLVNWITHFERRYKQYKEWIDVEEPKVIWLSGLHIPESYLTALIQTTCRAKGWALDKSTMYTNVTSHRDGKAITKRLDQGTYVQGLYIEGARWNTDEDCLDQQKPKELVNEMPLVQIIPVEANKLKLRGTLKTPVYITQLRRNAMGVGLVCEADLKTKKHASHWVLQGVALMLNTD